TVVAENQKTHAGRIGGEQAPRHEDTVGGGHRDDAAIEVFHFPTLVEQGVRLGDARIARHATEADRSDFIIVVVFREDGEVVGGGGAGDDGDALIIATESGGTIEV